MLKKIAPITMAVVTVLAVGACSKAAEPVNTASGTTPSTSAPATSSPDTTEKKTTDTTRPRSSGTTQATHTTGTTKSQGFELTSDEDECVSTALDSFPSTKVALQNDDTLTAEQSGQLGGIIVGCLPKPRLADGLIDGLKDSPDGADLTDTQVSCIRDQIISLDSEDLATFVGIIVYSGEAGDKSIAAPTISKLNSACGTKLAA